jgi:hypothetical protein
MPSLQSLTFDTSELQLDREESDRKVWFTKDGDGISLNFFDAPPNLPSDVKSSEQVRDFYLSMLQGTPTKLVEMRITRISGCPAIRLILKSPHKPQKASGMTYLGSITIPFRDFSYVVKCQCHERGTTGIREAILFDLMRSSGVISIDSSGKITGEWNSDAEAHDADFPQHPLSKLRKLLGQIEATGEIDPATRSEPTFPLPS